MKMSKILIILGLVILILVEGIFFYQQHQNLDNKNQIETMTQDEKDYPNLNFVNFAEYNQIYESGQKSIVVYVQEGCGYCIKYKPILNEIAKEQGITINILDILTLTDAEIEQLLNSLAYFSQNGNWGTPLTLIIENRQAVDSLGGLASKDDTLQFYQKNGFGK